MIATERHSLLARQIRRFLGSDEGISGRCKALLDAVDDAYWQADRDRALLERSMDLSSQELLQANDALRQSLAQLQAAEEERARLQVMGALGHLVGGLAHEVRNPLFAITATLDALLANLEDTPEHQTVRRALQGLMEPTARLSALMAELLEYGKPLGRNLAAGPLGAVILEALADCRPLALSRGVQLRAELGDRERTVGMIRSRLLMALDNLVQNAVQHTPAGGEVVVEMTAVQEGGQPWARCSVKDSGPGFQEEDLPRLFEPFFTRRRGGTGLGLSIVQRVVEEQRARLVAANRPEGGAVVTLDIPEWRAPV
ncbi:MAG TPA: HAMP domain-containing sensor histidine kinase [Thermoanaerobaculia bacterium]|nr:HAMP domain-containing sensor histidine kinase [Thermoanaerobaculia bacterium]